MLLSFAAFVWPLRGTSLACLAKAVQCLQTPEGVRSVAETQYTDFASLCRV